MKGVQALGWPNLKLATLARQASVVKRGRESS
jgi:hypothetical protein